MTRRTQLQILLDASHAMFPTMRLPLDVNSTSARNRALELLKNRVLRRERAKRRDMKKKMKKLFENYQKRPTYIVGEWGSETSPSPEKIILSLLKKYPGQRIRMVAYNSKSDEIVRKVRDSYTHIENLNTQLNCVVHRKVDSVFSQHTQAIYCDRVYTIPQGNNATINRWWRDNRIAVHWLFTYPVVPQNSPEPVLIPGDTIKIYVAESVISQPSPIQYFAQGVSHCLIQPIINDFTKTRDSLKKPSKQSLSNYNCAIEKLSNYAQKYAKGISVPSLFEMVEDVSSSKKINISITVPCARLNEEQFLKINNQYGHGNRYTFVNWRFHHVDEIDSTTFKDTTKNAIHTSREELRNKIKEMNQNNEFVEWKCDGQGPKIAFTKDAVYRCNSEFNSSTREFCSQFNGYRIDDISDNLMSQFILEGVHFCCNASFQIQQKEEKLRCFDIIKSYATFYNSRFYDKCQFPGKLNIVSPCDRIMGPGYYRIKDINFEKANSKFLEICLKMGSPFIDGNVYAVPLLDLLTYHGVTYTITMGCWAGGTKNRVDFRFPQATIENKEYAIIVGLWKSLKHENCTYIKGTSRFASHLKSTSENCDVNWFPKTSFNEWASDDGTIEVRYPKKHVWHLSQFSGYINAYEFIKMTDQLMLVNLSKVIQLQKDDFLCIDHEFELLPYMNEKTHELFVNNDFGISKLDRKLQWNADDDIGIQCYLSNITIGKGGEGMCWWNFNPVFEKINKKFDEHQKRFSHIDRSKIINNSCICLDGPGGTGKSDWILRDETLQRKCYISQSHKLGRAKAAEYKLVFDRSCDLEKITSHAQSNGLKYKKEDQFQVTVWARALHNSPTTYEIIYNNANCLIFDEVSMMPSETAQFIMNRFKEHKIFFVGDPGFQLKFYQTNGDNGTNYTPFSAAKLGLPTYTFNKIFRVQCEKLLAIRLEGRQMLEKGVTTMTHEEYRSIYMNTIFPDEWGETKYGKAGPVANMTFLEAETSVPDYIKYALSERPERGILHSYCRFACRQFHEEQPISIDDIKKFYMPKFTKVDSMEEVAKLYKSFEEKDGKFIPKDMIICSTNEFADQWTDFLKDKQIYFEIEEKIKTKQGSLSQYYTDFPDAIETLNKKAENASKKYNEANAKIQHTICSVLQEKEALLNSFQSNVVEYIKSKENFDAPGPKLIEESDLNTMLSEIKKTKEGLLQLMKYKETCTQISKAKDALEASRKRFLHYTELQGEAMHTDITEITQKRTIQLQKWKVKTQTRDYSNGDVVISEKSPVHGSHGGKPNSIMSHAFTAHSTIGETANGKVFIDSRNMFEIEHWETIIGRAKRWEDIIIIDLPDITPIDKYKDTKIYRIFSIKGDCEYIGHTTGDVTKRINKHINDRKKCTSSLVMKYKDYTWEILEHFPCSSKYQAEQRENYYIQNSTKSVNKSIPCHENLPPCAKKQKIMQTEVHTTCPIDLDQLNLAIKEESGDRLKFLKLLKAKARNGNLNEFYERRNGIGRLYSGIGKRPISIQGCYKDLRPRLCSNSKCFDMSNAIPTLLVQWCKYLQEAGCPLTQSDYKFLDEYVQNRKMWIYEIMSHHECNRESAKRLILIALYGGDPKYAINRNDEDRVNVGARHDNVWSKLMGFSESLSSMRDKIIDFQLTLPQYQNLYRIKRDQKGSDKKARISLFAIMTQELEAIVLDTIVEYCKNNEIDVHSLIFDGIMVDKNVISSDFIKGVQEYVSEIGLSITLVQEW